MGVHGQMRAAGAEKDNLSTPGVQKKTDRSDNMVDWEVFLTLSVKTT